MSHAKPKLDTRTDGALFACDLLDEIRKSPNADPFQWVSEKRTAEQEDNIVLRYLTDLQRRGTPDALAGFCSVVTDHVASYASGPYGPQGNLYRNLLIGDAAA